MKRFCEEKAFVDLKCYTREESEQKIKELLAKYPNSMRLYGTIIADNEIIFEIDISNPTSENIKLPDYDSFNGVLFLKIREYERNEL